MTDPTRMREAMTETFPAEQLSYRLTTTSLSEDLVGAGEPSSFVFHFPFEVREGDMIVARVHALAIRLAEAERVGFTAAEVFDSIDQELHEFYCAIYDQEGETFRGDLVDPTDLRDVLYIDSVKVIPSRRHKMVGLRAVERIREMLGGGCALLALKALPIDPENPKYSEAIDREVFGHPFPTRGEVAKAKLRDYWSRLGFARVDDTNFLVFDMSEDRPEF